MSNLDGGEGGKQGVLWEMCKMRINMVGARVSLKHLKIMLLVLVLMAK